jgi:hypothetical protein
VQNATEGGFQIHAWMSNSGSCAKFAGQTVSYDARGCSAGTVDWLETREVVKEVRGEVQSGDLSWAADVVVQMPQRLRGFTVSVQQLDGRAPALTAAGTERWFSVVRDGASTSLVLRPKSLADAMRE